MYAAPIFSVTMVEFNEEDDDGVVHAEVAEVGADPEDGLAEAGREAEGVAMSHLVPWPAGDERRFCPLLCARDEVERRAWARRDHSVRRHCCKPTTVAAAPTERERERERGIEFGGKNCIS
ncbi:hypothetical protein ACLOJK_005015, partial [Asimina triloba]